MYRTPSISARAADGDDALEEVGEVERTETGSMDNEEAERESRKGKDLKRLHVAK